MRQAALACTLFCPQILVAEGFAGETFSTWSDEVQNAYLQNMVVMSSMVSARTSPTHGDCISKWFFDGSSIRPDRKAEALATISEYGAHRPEAILIALMERACGPFGS
ncbi:MAG: hypothetical protein ABJL67_09290 [Sulfitobacter sp.]